jgi:hypothetical protein
MILTEQFNIMKIFKRIIFSLILLFSQLLTLASADSQAVNTINTPAVEIVRLSPYVRLFNVNVNTENNQLQVTGKVKKVRHNSHVLPGHIDYVVLDENQQIIQTGKVTYKPSLFLRSPKHGSEFKITLVNNIPEHAIIKLAWHHDKGENHLE